MKPFLVRTVSPPGRRVQALPEGSRFCVDRVFKRHFGGLWSCLFGTIRVKVPKDECVRVRRAKRS